MYLKRCGFDRLQEVEKHTVFVEKKYYSELDERTLGKLELRRQRIMSTHGSQTLAMDASREPTEKPENGVKGLKHWQYDLMAGLQVAMMGIPLSLGIAIASGA